MILAISRVRYKTHTLYKLKINPKEYAVRLNEMLCNPKSNQEKMSSIWSRPCRACLYIASRPVPIGDGVTHAVPIHKGFTLTHEVQIVDLAGSDLTDHLLKSLEGHDYTLPFVQYENVRDFNR
ncbi:actin [Mortierella sp. GBA43]|nr:actin [Mortierella sp. GBA43]